LFATGDAILLSKESNSSMATIEYELMRFRDRIRKRAFAL
jgi:hypothetical protein